MAKKDTKFKKGMSGNPGGRVKLPVELREAAKLSKKEALEKLIYFLQMSKEDLLAITKNDTLKVMDHWVARICELGIEHGDAQRLNFMFDRIIGKVTDKVEHSVPKPTIITLSNGDKMIAGRIEALDEGEL